MRSVLLALSIVAGAAILTGPSVITALPPDESAINANDGYGLVGDGIADDTDALAAAINATYASGVDCTQPGARIVFLAGDGKTYRLSGTVTLPMWVRLVGWGATTRPALLLAPNTSGFSNSSALAGLLQAINWAPFAQCNTSAYKGGNTAFGTGVINVDVRIGAGNPGAVGISNGVAQGGVLRAMAFDLAPDAAAGVYSPGWAHQDLTFNGGRYGVLVLQTGAWPSLFRDCSWTGQATAAVGWSANDTSSWEGLTLLRARITDVPVAFDMSGGTTSVCAWVVDE
jgi:hypothetical protein